MLYNLFNCYIWVGKEADPYFLDLLFNVERQEDILNIQISEYEMFSEEQMAKAWISELYNIL